MPSLPSLRLLAWPLRAWTRFSPGFLPYGGSGSRAARAYFHWNPVNTFVSAVEFQLAAMQRDASQRAINLSAVLGFMRNELHFYRRRNLLSPLVPTAVATPGASAYAQFRGALATNQTFVSNVSQVPPQRIDYTRLTAKLRETLDEQIAKREKDQSIVSYAMSFLNAVGIHNDTIMVVEFRILE
eukprot:1873278-Pleurochrysis_carterae.AAC.1